MPRTPASVLDGTPSSAISAAAMAFIAFREIAWPDAAPALFHTSVADVHAWRDRLVADGAAPETLNRRIASLSGFFKYLQAAAAELRLPITVPNPAHA